MRATMGLRDLVVGTAAVILGHRKEALLCALGAFTGVEGKKAGMMVVDFMAEGHAGGEVCEQGGVSVALGEVFRR